MAGSGQRTKWASSWIGGALLVALCLAAYLPGLRAVPPFDGDEARYADAAREMLAAHDWRAFIIPHIEGAPRLNKPPLMYWLEAASAYVVSGGDPAALSYPAALEREARGQRTLTGSPPTRSRVFTGGIGAYRLPSVIATILATLIIWRLGCQMFAAPCALLAAALWACCFLVVVDARLARTDQVLVLFTCIAQWSLWNLWRRAHAGGGWVILFWSGVGLGMMTKGPVTPGVAALTILMLCVLTRDWAWLRRLRWGIGLLILAVIVVPWVALAMHIMGVGVFVKVLWQELVLRGVSASGGRAGPPGYHLVLLWGLFWPGALLVIPATIFAVRRGLRWSGKSSTSEPTALSRSEIQSEPRAQAREPDFVTRLPDAGCSRKTVQLRAGANGWRAWIPRPGRGAELFCLAWIVPSWIVCELAETKLPHYTLPLYPAMALLCGRAAWSVSSGKLAFLRSRATFLGDTIWVLLGAGLTLALPLYFALRGSLRHEPGVMLALLAGVVLLAALLIVSWVLVRRKRFVAGLSIAMCASILGGRCLFQTVLPNLSAPWMSSVLVRELARIDPHGDRPLAAAGYYHESLAFLTGGRVTYLAPTDLDAWLEEHPNGLAIAPANVYVDAADQPARPLITIEGFDYIEGAAATLVVFARRP